MMKICCPKKYLQLSKITTMLLFLMSLAFYQIFLHALSSKFLLLRKFQQLIWHQNWREIADTLIDDHAVFTHNLVILEKRSRSSLVFAT